MAVQHHPDKGGDEHTFKEINAAYEILSDPEQRSKYDQYGLEGLVDEGGGGGGRGRAAEDLFSMFFGGGVRRSGPQRGNDIDHTVKATLEELYSGKTVKFAVSRNVLEGEPRRCPTCDGDGIVLELRQIGLGMVQQIQRHCSDCQGEGYRCKRRKDRKVLDVLVEKGMRHNQKIVFRGMADEMPNMEPGNINFIVQEQPHKLFKRKGADLLISKTLSLKEALCGFAWKINHLDGREVVIQSKPGEVIRPDGEGNSYFVKIVPNEGMPSHGNPFVKGNLYVRFVVEFPRDNDLPPEAVDALRKALPGPSMDVEYDQETAEIVHLEHADVRSFGKGGLQSRDSAVDSDDEDGGGPQAVNCQQS